MSERFIVTRFREHQPEPPLRESRLPEMDPGEVAALCDVCGAWGIVDLSDVAELDPTAALGLRPGLACHDCREGAHELAEDVDDRTDGGEAA